MLYNFSKLDKKLDLLEYPKVDYKSGFKTIQGINFTKAYKVGAIHFEDDGIYLENEGQKYRGYMFIKEAYISYNGQPPVFPKFHLLKCSKIQEFIGKGKFNQRYEWSNSNVNDLIDKQSKTKHNDIKLEVCAYCKSALQEKIKNTQDFYEILKKYETEANIFDVDISGYQYTQEKVSKQYRSQKNYICEECSIAPKNPLHRRWWHTHHIDGNKSNNSNTNLKCLCILCHSNVDARHKKNFSKNFMSKQLKSFIIEYEEDLKRLNTLNE